MHIRGFQKSFSPSRFKAIEDSMFKAIEDSQKYLSEVNVQGD
ncbi:hypothetical protein MmTuc01_3348 [Methanosarcina mazei Tuc01]|uniref:Uncharacterized protein n=1 Tax=Methanosarcina mazei Tuc01 TaxID=1236903 RepID=M1PDH0_METMZ|nr:hypothetical protein MmTuc01_3348 [Methanosarcina mazei Tuc01]